MLVFPAGATGPWRAAESGWGEQDASLAGDSGLREGLLESGIPKLVAKSQELQKRVGRPGLSQSLAGWGCPGWKEGGRAQVAPEHPVYAPEHRLHKHSQCLDVDPGNKGFAEVDLEPSQQRALQRIGER